MDFRKLQALLQLHLDKDLLLDLDDQLRSRALNAHTMIRDHAALDARRSRLVEGRVRFPMQEQAFQEICISYGGDELMLDVLPGTDLKVYQPFMRFLKPGAAHAVILGFAAMPEAGVLPARNLSRGAAASLNYDIEERFDFDGKGPKIGDVYVMFLAAPDKQNAGMVAEVAIGVVDSEYQKYILYSDVETFISSYSHAPPAEQPPEGEKGKGLDVRLRKQPKPFVAPEDATDSDEEKNKKKK